jgi:uncharacterized iron-regulated membrane protein
VVLHRYVGIAVGLVMLMWFASGAVMLFVHWPEVTEPERAAGLEPISWSRCCAFGDIQDMQEVKHAVVEDLAGRPVLRFDGQVLDLSTGQPVHAVSQMEAAQAATAFATAAGIPGWPGHPQRVARDQWTVTGYFDKKRPFWRFRFDGPSATDVYVSAHTGQVAQVTDRPTRVLNWLGAIPHWLYPSILRADTALWSQVVIWLSIVGTFLTLTGIYLGVVAWRPWSDGRLTPYRGLMAWHHLTGLFAGLLTLTWVASGLVSMNPWGFLESRPDDRAERLTGAFTFGDLRQAVSAAKGAAARQMETAPFEGRLYLMADGRRLDATGRPTPLTEAQLATAASRLGPVTSRGLIRGEDAYYFGHHEPVTLPAYKVVLKDGMRFYLDPASGQVLSRVDGAARGYRWLHEGLHRLDFIRGFDRGAGWAAAMTALLALAGFGVATGVWLGWRRLKADLGGLRRTKAPGPA